jgi:hypothetical protein
VSAAGVERMQTGTCRGCGEVKGLRKNGTVAVHKAMINGEWVRCPGYLRHPKGIY